MRIKLEYDDRPVFSTVHGPGATERRVMLVRIGGRPFTVWRTVDPTEVYFFQPGYMDEVDRALVAAMEQMFTKLFLDACAAVPEGMELLRQ